MDVTPRRLAHGPVVSPVGASPEGIAVLSQHVGARQRIGFLELRYELRLSMGVDVCLRNGHIYALDTFESFIITPFAVSVSTAFEVLLALKFARDARLAYR